MIYEAKILETLEPYATLKFEQEVYKDELDFRLLDTKTLGQNLRPAKRRVYSLHELDLFYSDDFYTNTYESVTQKYVIEIFPKKEKKQFRFILKTDPSCIYLNAILVCEPELQFYEGFKYDFFQTLYKEMIKQKILIIRTDKKLNENVDVFIEKLKIKKHSKRTEFVIAKGVESIDEIPGQIIFHQKLNDNKFLEEDINYDEGAYCKPVQKDELLFEYIHRKTGKNGRNLRGDLLSLTPVKALENPFIAKDDSIYEVKFEDRIKYFSANYGFLVNRNKIYSVTNVLKFNQVGLKKTGSIKADLDEEIVLEVSNNNSPLEDAVKSGIVNIKASKVDIDGNVGATELNSKVLNIKGITHAKSKIFTQMAYIGIHKGYLEADIVHIKNLENGKVIAKTVFVDNCASSQIEADNIYIKNMLYGNKIYPKKCLVIENMIKNDNLIDVNPYSIKDNQEYDRLEDLLEQVESKIYSTIKSMNNLYQYLVKNQGKTVSLQQEKNSGNYSVIHEKFLNLYFHTIEKYNKYLKKYKKLINLKYKIASSLKRYENMVYEVKICIKAKTIGEYNSVCFKPLNMQKINFKYTLSFKNVNCSVIYLTRNEQGKLFIEANDKISDIQLSWIEDQMQKLQTIIEDKEKRKNKN